MTVLYDLTMAARYCDRMLLLDRGRLAADGPPATVLTSEMLAMIDSISAFMGQDNASRMIVPLARIKQGELRI